MRSWLLPLAPTASDPTVLSQAPSLSSTPHSSGFLVCHPVSWTCLLSVSSPFLFQPDSRDQLRLITHTCGSLDLCVAHFSIFATPLPMLLPANPVTGFWWWEWPGLRCSPLGAPLPHPSQYVGTRNVLSVIHCLDDSPKAAELPISSSVFLEDAKKIHL